MTNAPTKAPAPDFAEAVERFETAVWARAQYIAAYPHAVSMRHVDERDAARSSLLAQDAAMRVALREAEDFISAQHESLTTGEVDNSDAAEVLALIRTTLNQAPETGR